MPVKKTRGSYFYKQDNGRMAAFTLICGLMAPLPGPALFVPGT